MLGPPAHRPMNEAKIIGARAMTATATKNPPTPEPGPSQLIPVPSPPPAVAACAPSPTGTLSAIHSRQPPGGMAPGQKPDSARMHGPQLALPWACPSHEPTGYRCESPRAESHAAPAKPEAERPSLSNPTPFRSALGLKSSRQRTVAIAKSTSFESVGSRRNSASGNSSAGFFRPRLKSPPAPASTSPAPSIPQPSTQTANAAVV